MILSPFFYNKNDGLNKTYSDLNEIRLNHTDCKMNLKNNTVLFIRDWHYQISSLPIL